MSKKPKILADVKVGDAIRSGGAQWVVTRVGPALVYAIGIASSGAAITRSWHYDGSPGSACEPAVPDERWCGRRSATMRKKPKAFADVQVGDAIWSGGHRWIVTKLLKSNFQAERRGLWSATRGAWSYSGAPISSAFHPADPETPELRMRWLSQQAEKDAQERAAQEARRAEDIVSAALSRLRLSYVEYPTTTRFTSIRTLPLAKALALARFVDQLTREGE